jgi:hypothetical protein
MRPATTIGILAALRRIDTIVPATHHWGTTSMREATERQFRQLLEQHDREFLRSASRDGRLALREQEFDRRFREHVTDVVMPIMTRLRTLMRDHDLHSEIIVTQRHTEADGKITPSSIVFEFRVLTDPETHGFPITTPTLAFIADPANTAVLVHENTVLPFLGGHVGLIDHCPLDQLSTDRVEKHLLAVAKKVLRGTGVS